MFKFIIVWLQITTLVSLPKIGFGYTITFTSAVSAQSNTLEAINWYTPCVLMEVGVFTSVLASVHLVYKPVVL